jgi:hypothetical protein
MRERLSLHKRRSSQVAAQTDAEDAVQKATLRLVSAQPLSCNFRGVIIRRARCQLRRRIGSPNEAAVQGQLLEREAAAAASTSRCPRSFARSYLARASVMIAAEKVALEPSGRRC